MSLNKKAILARLDELSPQELKRYLVQELTHKRLGLTWEADLIERDKALNSDLVFPRVDPELSHWPEQSASNNLIIEGDNFDSLRLLRSTHRGRIRVVMIDPPYNTGNGSDWVYNDSFVKKDDRWRHSKWLEFMYQRLLIARDLLTPDGVIMVCINDENRSKLELMMDEVMPGLRVGSFVWRVRSGGNDTKGALLSMNHEHVLVYGNPAFSFKGDERDQSSYTNPDDDPRGAWQNDNLVKAHNAKQRPEAYYHIRNPETDIWYPCDPDSVWRFASTTRPTKKALQADPIEVVIEERRVLWPTQDAYVQYDSLGDLKKAIKDGDAPKQLKIYNSLKNLERQSASDARIKRLLDYIEPLEFWVGKKIGTRKPRYKRFQKDLKRDIRPVSSWLQASALADESATDESLDSLTVITVGATGEGTNNYKQILNNKDFPYPKPPSLMRELLRQAMRPDDIALDFFAGSGTTGQAVLELNAEDDGNRRFILCSNAEASNKAPDRNICRDVCAERVRRVMSGYGDTPGLGGDFTYVTLDKVEEADLMFEAEPRHAFGLLSLRETGYLSEPPVDQPVWVVAQTASSAIVLCPRLSDEAVAALEALPVSQLIVYTDRPDSLQEALAGDKSVTCYSIESALRYAQGGNQASILKESSTVDAEPAQEVSQ
ncbi:site-specific DNA-methyltransferase [Marinobacter nauticus]|uniref:site-specific DNA-methyltransferase (adenine-specific) n=1 Tax=Marinobacter nauticus (strain ATCC 700491 / DSM 11845 / VT8) TaxID=351348 RepID=A1U7X2_MARN8|nr:site-specific DNA-methyltransferase [Marinobacter nauticus]ABM21091.1 DNA methylase N-4/N-6 domain protein [Marinobacter nauticus VT8]